MIRDFLEKHASKEPVSFHMPGHKGEDIFRRFGYDFFLDNIASCDITEIPGADNLFINSGIIGDTMKKYEKLYGVRKSYLLVNGSSCGNIAAVLSSVERCGKVIIARNCHKSVFNAARLGNLKTEYVFPELTEDGITGEITTESVEEIIRRNSDAKAMVITSPNYYGICSDIPKIADICHRYGIILIVDQAHGAHLKFFNEKLSAEYGDADIIINSIHKTLCSFTQSAVLNVNSERIDTDVLEDWLQILESTSPSYLLMASLDICADILKDHGNVLMEEWRENLDYTYKALDNAGIRYIKHKLLDNTKINIDMGFSAAELEKKLNEQGIFPELNTGSILMLMSGLGNRKSDYERFVDSIVNMERPKTDESQRDNKAGEIVIKKRETGTLSGKKIKVKLAEAEGRTVMENIIPYPPGIPAVCPGEIIDRNDIETIESMLDSGELVIGIDENRMIYVGE